MEAPIKTYLLLFLALLTNVSFAECYSLNESGRENLIKGHGLRGEAGGSLQSILDFKDEMDQDEFCENALTGIDQATSGYHYLSSAIDQFTEALDYCTGENYSIVSKNLSLAEEEIGIIQTYNSQLNEQYKKNCVIEIH